VFKADKYRKYIIIALIVLLFLLFGSLSISRYIAAESFMKAEELFNNAQAISEDILLEKSFAYQKTIRLLNRAISHNKYNADYYSFLSSLLYTVVDNQSLAELIMINNKDYFKSHKILDAAEWYQAEAILRNPANYLYYYKLAELYIKSGDTIKAEEQLKKSILFDPQNINLNLSLAKFYLDRGDSEEFKKYLKVAMGLDRLESKGKVSEKMNNFLIGIGQEGAVTE
jgi:tetratricopeptide (TPR) repeat protein